MIPIILAAESLTNGYDVIEMAIIAIVLIVWIIKKTS